LRNFAGEYDNACFRTLPLRGRVAINIWVLKLERGGKKTEHNTIRLKFTANPAEPVATFE